MKQEKRPSPEKTTLQPKLSVGRVVHYVQPDGTDQGIHRAALVGLDFAGREMVLTIFIGQQVSARRLKDVPQDEETKRPETWHWPERE